MGVCGCFLRLPPAVLLVTSVALAPWSLTFSCPCMCPPARVCVLLSVYVSSCNIAIPALDVGTSRKVAEGTRLACCLWCCCRLAARILTFCLPFYLLFCAAQSYVVKYQRITMQGCDPTRIWTPFFCQLVLQSTSSQRKRAGTHSRERTGTEHTVTRWYPNPRQTYTKNKYSFPCFVL